MVDRLLVDEHRYRPATRTLIDEVADHETFPDMEALDDAGLRIARARRAVTELRRWHGLRLAGQERDLADGLAVLRTRLLDLQGGRDPQARGAAFETSSTTCSASKRGWPTGWRARSSTAH